MIRWRAAVTVACIIGVFQAGGVACADREPPPAGPDLSRLPEVDDDAARQEAAPQRVPEDYRPGPNQSPVPYLGPMLTEPDINFVPAEPSTTLDPGSAWDHILVPPPPTQRELAARRLRNGGLGLLVVGTLLACVAVPTIASRPDETAYQAVGYTALSLSLISFAAGGALFGVGDVRLRAARRAAAGLAW